MNWEALKKKMMRSYREPETRLTKITHAHSYRFVRWKIQIWPPSLRGEKNGFSPKIRNMSLLYQYWDYHRSHSYQKSAFYPRNRIVMSPRTPEFVRKWSRFLRCLQRYRDPHQPRNLRRRWASMGSTLIIPWAHLSWAMMDPAKDKQVSLCDSWVWAGTRHHRWLVSIASH